MRTPLVLMTFAYAAGILLGWGFLYFPGSITAFAAVLGFIQAVLLGRGTLGKRTFAVVTVAALAGAGAYLSAAAWFPVDHVSRLSFDSQQHEIIGRIASPLDRDPDRTAAVLELNQLDGTPVTGKARFTLRSSEPPFGYGDTVRADARIFTPRGYANPGGFDYPAYLAQNGISATVAVKDAGSITVLSRGSGVFRSIQDLRERMRQALLAALHGPGSAILQAMVLGEEGGLDEDLRDRFMTAGVTHIISISGSHLGMVALLCFGLLRGLMFLLPEAWYHRLTLFTDPRKIAAWLTLPLIAFYCLAAGAQTATVRSCIMLSAGLAALLLDRDHALAQALAFAALVSLIADPQALFDISFQLSYLSVLVIAAVAGLYADVRITAETRLRKIGQQAVMLVVLSLAVSAASGPFTALYFNQLSLMGIVSNLLVVPFAGLLVVPLGLFSALVSLFTGTLPFAGLNQTVADAFIGLVGFFASIPGAELHVRGPGAVWTVLYLAMIASGFLWFGTVLRARLQPLEHSRRPHVHVKTTFVVSLSCLLMLTFTPLMRHKGTRIHFIDVGQGDSALVELASGATVLIDGGGTRDNRFDIGRRVVAPFLWERGIRKLDLVVLSHPHPDHMNGLLFVLHKFSVGELWTHGLDTGLPGYDALREVIARENIPHRMVAADDHCPAVRNGAVRVLHPGRTFSAEGGKAYAEENDRSLVVRLADENGAYLFPGDIGLSAERHLLDEGCDIACDILKVPHHGSKSSSSEAFLAAVRPAIAVVSAGQGNLYGHPAPEVTGRYARAGIRLYRTDRDGAVAIRVHSGRREVFCWKELMLRRIDLRDRGAWRENERANLRRIWIRSRGI